MAYDQQCEPLRFVRRNNSFRFRWFRLVDTRNETADVLAWLGRRRWPSRRGAGDNSLRPPKLR